MLVTPQVGGVLAEIHKTAERECAFAPDPSCPNTNWYGNTPEEQRENFCAPCWARWLIDVFREVGP